MKGGLAKLMVIEPQKELCLHFPKWVVNSFLDMFCKLVVDDIFPTKGLNPEALQQPLQTRAVACDMTSDSI